jgi:hypothetical protein
MKKVVCLIAVLALTATVCAQCPDPGEPITITAVPDGDTLTIGYNATGATMPVGISLIVDCGAGKVAVAGDADFSIDSFFDVFIDFAADDPNYYRDNANAETGVLNGAHGLAKTDTAGAADFGTEGVSVFAISAAELANPAGIQAVGTICTLKISADTYPVTVTFADDDLRGQVVDVNGCPMDVTLPGSVQVPGPSPSTCWDACPGQPFGDATCDGSVNLADLAAVKSSWNLSYGQENYNCCANFDHIGAINLADLAIIKQNWNGTFSAPATPVLDCPVETP